MIFHTRSGSTYEINGNEIRLIRSPRAPHHSMSHDWRTFSHADIDLGARAVIQWPDNKVTVTTIVMRVEE